MRSQKISSRTQRHNNKGNNNNNNPIHIITTTRASHLQNTNLETDSTSKQLSQLTIKTMQSPSHIKTKKHHSSKRNIIHTNTHKARNSSLSSVIEEETSSSNSLINDKQTEYQTSQMNAIHFQDDNKSYR
jgi:hypothetical protein